MFLKAITNSASPSLLVGHEIGLGVTRLKHKVRACVDALGRPNQRVLIA